MKKLISGLLVYIFGLALVVLSVIFAGAWLPVGVALSAVVMCAGGAIILASRLRRPTPALMRLNWFLPFVRKQKGETARTPSRMRRLLKRLGPSVVASPARRIVQAACLALFLVLFYYVCWPYTARPAPPGRQSPGWKLADIDQASGRFRFSHPEPATWALKDGGRVHLVDQSAANPEEGYAGEFRVARASSQQVALESLGEPTEEQLDSLLTSLGPWCLRERPPDEWPSHYADDLARKEFVPAEVFLVIDPLVALSTAIAARSWVWSLSAAAVILIVCVLVPRGFCGYICPLGTVIDLFDWGISRRVKRFRVGDNGWWVHLKYYLLAGVLIAAAMGVLVSGFVAAIPVVTRALLFITEPLQTGTMRGWHLIPSMNAGHVFSIVLFLGLLSLGLLRPRFWCRYVCPSGAVFSVSNLFRITERKVESSCINCNKCVEICPFDAIKPDFTTRGSDCTFCQSCGGVCPTHAIKFVERWNGAELKVVNDPPTGDTPIGRRGFLSWTAGSAAALAGGVSIGALAGTHGATGEDASSSPPVRPPGSVPEDAFLQLCIRCGECFKVCPNNVLQAQGLALGWEGLWTPRVVADWAGCESSCNACGQVCPTGAIRALPLEEKRHARMGLAIVNPRTCLPLADREPCQLCVDECNAAGYEAIEFMRVNTRVNDEGMPIAGTGMLAPVVIADRCVGCGLCQTRCHGINVKTKGLLSESAIIVQAGEGKEDRLTSGSYLELRRAEARKRLQQQREAETEFFVPESRAADEPPPPGKSDNPFGL